MDDKTKYIIRENGVEIDIFPEMEAFPNYNEAVVDAILEYLQLEVTFCSTHEDKRDRIKLKKKKE